MTNGLHQSQDEVEALLKESPQLQYFSNRLITVEELKKIAREEKDPAYIADGYETVLKRLECLYADIATWHSNECDEVFIKLNDILTEANEQNKRLSEVLQEERQAYRNYHEDICSCMMADPRGTFENVILKAIERKKKIESGDGWDNWQWSLNFPIIARLRMAYKLIFLKGYVIKV